MNWIRVWWPGINPLDNSYRLNVALYNKGNDRGKKQDPAGMEDQVKNAMKDLEQQIRTGKIKG